MISSTEWKTISAKHGKRSISKQARVGEKGFSLFVTMLALSSMIGMLGLSFDLGHMFIVRTELQTFVDASVVAAATQLDGTSSGIQKANVTVIAGPLGATRPNGWDFDTKVISNVTATFATSFNGTYDSYATSSASGSNSYRFINAVASANVPVYFMPVLNLFKTGTNISNTSTLSASATAGQQPHSSVTNGGLAPFSPAAHNAADTTNFGFTKGSSYTLKWGNGNTTSCSGDSGFNPGNASSEHGFVDLGQGNSNNSLRGVIVYGGYPNSTSSPSSVSAGDTLGGVPGNRGSSIFDASSTRSAQDSDQSSTTWEQYKSSGTGNNRRVITVPIHDPASVSGNGGNLEMGVIGFGNFLLDTANNIAGNSGSLCAAYIGPGSYSGGASAATDGTKIYSIVLYK